MHTTPALQRLTDTQFHALVADAERRLKEDGEPSRKSLMHKIGVAVYAAFYARRRDFQEFPLPPDDVEAVRQAVIEKVIPF